MTVSFEMDGFQPPVGATAFQTAAEGRLVASWDQGSNHLFLDILFSLSFPPANVNMS